VSSLPGTPNLVTVGTVHVTITAQPDPATALTACTCGHRCTNPADCATWAHNNHTRQHQGRNRSRR
jgi:hypothetical protein